MLSNYNREYHWIIINPTQTFAMIATYDGKLRLINIEDRTNPVLVSEYKPKTGLCYAFSFHPVYHNLVVACGGRSEIELITIGDYNDPKSWKSK